MLDLAQRRGDQLNKKVGRPMQDLLWILVIVGLLALTLAYVRLCEQA